MFEDLMEQTESDPEQQIRTANLQKKIMEVGTFRKSIETSSHTVSRKG